ncbi:MAG: hypothetical protein AAGA77_06875 [Bacteroidota bacterium]
MESGKYQMGLITDSIVSNNFSVATFSESDASVEIDVPVIKKYISDLNISTSIEHTQNNVIKFSNPSPIPFAFSCIDLGIDEDGYFIAGDWHDGLKEATRSGFSEDRIIEKILIDEDGYEPLLIE